MKKQFFLSFCFLLLFTVWAESIYTISFTRIEGGSFSLSANQGKKIMIIVLPLSQTASNDSLLRSVDSLKNVYGNTLNIIGVPAYEDGYTSTMKNSLKTWYRSILRSEIIIAEGLRTRKTSSNQHPLFKWLTQKEKNGHFDQDVAGPRHKFFVSASGSLTAVLGPSVRIGGSTVNRLLQAQ